MNSMGKKSLCFERKEKKEKWEEEDEEGKGKGEERERRSRKEGRERLFRGLYKMSRGKWDYGTSLMSQSSHKVLGTVYDPGQELSKCQGCPAASQPVSAISGFLELYLYLGKKTESNSGCDAIHFHSSALPGSPDMAATAVHLTLGSRCGSIHLHCPESLRTVPELCGASADSCPCNQWPQYPAHLVAVANHVWLLKIPLHMPREARVLPVIMPS